MLAQIFLGSVLLALCSVLFVVCLVLAARFLTNLDQIDPAGPGFRHSALLMGSGVVAIVAGHTVVVWIWALSFVLSGALPTYAEAVYFTLVTYTTLGYGDVTLAPEFRIFGAMAAVAGLVNFGLSAAFLVAALGRIFPGMRQH